ncbi:GGDEF domain-containing protein [Thalassotalea sp. M1531]|uniref:diguanylate cyclase n=1 Tax=Thalassotalea algicola TaxID=2716224 RepID=A0A7Y0LB40_9GAMM|nr:GGDEF domain-containing protein [Thalassotalea algicola]NMP31269.1 GGDEF domain-containing protein [Thalassotalea algicola]
MLEKLISLGTAFKPFSVANKVRMMNLIALITCVISGLYTLSYVFVLDNQIVASINALFTLAYALTLVFNHYQAFKGSKIWFFCVLMVHLLVCTNLYVTNESGFHLYYFLVPTGAFLLFELQEKKEKVLLSLTAVILYFYCENTINTTPLIELSDELNHLIYQSVILVNMLEVILVLTIFANEIEANELKLTRQATTDSLTGIANRHSFFEQGKALFSSAQSHQRPFTIVLLDFDYFKRINDQYGHFVGDLCLTEITKVVTSQCRKQDLFARIGGEEFAIILPDTTQQEANNIAEQLRLSIECHNIPIVGEQYFTCTASFGIASKSPHCKTMKDVLIHADKALYLAKELGRNRVQLYQESA